MNPGHVSVALLNVIKNWSVQAVTENLPRMMSDNAVTVVNAIKEHITDINSIEVSVFVFLTNTFIKSKSILLFIRPLNVHSK